MTAISCLYCVFKCTSACKQHRVIDCQFDILTLAIISRRAALVLGMQGMPRVFAHARAQAAKHLLVIASC